MHHGAVPDGMEIDHKNGNPSDNTLNNLRLATHAQNGVNRKVPSNSTSGHKGVSQRKGANRWRAYITVTGKRKYIGDFPTIEGAIHARTQMAKAIHGEFFRER